VDTEHTETALHDTVPPWEAYHRAMCDARAARGQLLRTLFLAAVKSLKARVCSQAHKWDIRLCPLCCWMAV